MKHDRLITLPHPSLRRKSKTVKAPSPAIGQLVENMTAVTLDWEAHRQHELGVALAAVQINELLRVIIVRRNLRGPEQPQFDVYLNPVITRYEGEPVEEPEGCISVKDIYGNVARYPRVKVKALDLTGRPVKLVAKGFLARIFQHEIDHTHGITFVDRCGKGGEFFALEPDGKMQPLTDAQRRTFIDKVGVYPSDQESSRAR